MKTAQLEFLNKHVVFIKSLSNGYLNLWLLEFDIHDEPLDKWRLYLMIKKMWTLCELLLNLLQILKLSKGLIKFDIISAEKNH